MRAARKLRLRQISLPINTWRMAETPAILKRVRVDSSLGDIKKWKRIGRKSAVTFFKTPSGVNVAVRPELGITRAGATIAMHKNNPRQRRTFNALKELLRRGVRIETPLGELVTSEGIVCCVTKMEDGVTLNEFLNQTKPKKQQVLNVAKSMAQELANIHKKGVLHNHPHDGNWLIHNGKATLIDPKQVTFREEYPWHTKFGNTYTFEQLAKQEADSAKTWLPKYAQERFVQEYEKHFA
ncbi:MAG: hypothetical protein WCW13_02370 [archaeon]|jgi:hypothetical protein